MVWRDVTLIEVHEEIEPMQIDKRKRWFYMASEFGVAMIVASILVGGLMFIGGLLG